LILLDVFFFHNEKLRELKRNLSRKVVTPKSSDSTKNPAVGSGLPSQQLKESVGCSSKMNESMREDEHLEEMEEIENTDIPRAMSGVTISDPLPYMRTPGPYDSS